MIAVLIRILLTLGGGILMGKLLFAALVILALLLLRGRFSQRASTRGIYAPSIWGVRR